MDFPEFGDSYSPNPFHAESANNVASLLADSTELLPLGDSTEMNMLSSFPALQTFPQNGFIPASSTLSGNFAPNGPSEIVYDSPQMKPANLRSSSSTMSVNTLVCSPVSLAQSSTETSRDGSPTTSQHCRDLSASNPHLHNNQQQQRLPQVIDNSLDNQNHGHRYDQSNPFVNETQVGQHAVKLDHQSLILNSFHTQSSSSVLKEEQRKSPMASAAKIPTNICHNVVAYPVVMSDNLRHNHDSTQQMRYMQQTQMYSMPQASPMSHGELVDMRNESSQNQSQHYPPFANQHTQPRQHVQQAPWNHHAHEPVTGTLGRSSSALSSEHDSTTTSSDMSSDKPKSQLKKTKEGKNTSQQHNSSPSAVSPSSGRTKIEASSLASLASTASTDSDLGALSRALSYNQFSSNLATLFNQQQQLTHGGLGTIDSTLVDKTSPFTSGKTNLDNTNRRKKNKSRGFDGGFDSTSTSGLNSGFGSEIEAQSADSDESEMDCVTSSNDQGDMEDGALRHEISSLSSVLSLAPRRSGRRCANATIMSSALAQSNHSTASSMVQSIPGEAVNINESRKRKLRNTLEISEDLPSENVASLASESTSVKKNGKASAKKEIISKQGVAKLEVVSTPSSISSLSSVPNKAYGSSRESFSHRVGESSSGDVEETSTVRIDLDDCVLNVPFESTEKLLMEMMRNMEQDARRVQNGAVSSTARNTAQGNEDEDEDSKPRKRAKKGEEKSKNSNSKATSKKNGEKGTKGSKAGSSSDQASSGAENGSFEGFSPEESIFLQMATRQAAALTPIPADIDADGDVEVKRERNKNSAAQYRRRRKLYLDLLEKRVRDMERSLLRKTHEIDSIQRRESSLNEQLQMVEDRLRANAQSLKAREHELELERQRVLQAEISMAEKLQQQQQQRVLVQQHQDGSTLIDGIQNSLQRGNPASSPSKLNNTSGSEQQLSSMSMHMQHPTQNMLHPSMQQISSGHSMHMQHPQMQIMPQMQQMGMPQMNMYPMQGPPQHIQHMQMQMQQGNIMYPMQHAHQMQQQQQHFHMTTHQQHTSQLPSQAHTPVQAYSQTHQHPTPPPYQPYQGSQLHTSSGVTSSTNTMDNRVETESPITASRSLDSAVTSGPSKASLSRSLSNSSGHSLSDVDHPLMPSFSHQPLVSQNNTVEAADAIGSISPLGSAAAPIGFINATHSLSPMTQGTLPSTTMNNHYSQQQSRQHPIPVISLENSTTTSVSLPSHESHNIAGHYFHHSHPHGHVGQTGPQMHMPIPMSQAPLQSQPHTHNHVPAPAPIHGFSSHYERFAPDFVSSTPSPPLASASGRNPTRETYGDVPSSPGSQGSLDSPNSHQGYYHRQQQQQQQQLQQQKVHVQSHSVVPPVGTISKGLSGPATSNANSSFNSSLSNTSSNSSTPTPNSPSVLHNASSSSPAPLDQTHMSGVQYHVHSHSYGAHNHAHLHAHAHAHSHVAHTHSVHPNSHMVTNPGVPTANMPNNMAGMSSRGVRMGGIFALLSCVLLTIFVPVSDPSGNSMGSIASVFLSGFSFSTPSELPVSNSVGLSGQLLEVDHSSTSLNEDIAGISGLLAESAESAVSAVYGSVSSAASVISHQISRRLLEASGFKSTTDFDLELLNLFGINSLGFEGTSTLVDAEERKFPNLGMFAPQEEDEYTQENEDEEVVDIGEVLSGDTSLSSNSHDVLLDTGVSKTTGTFDVSTKPTVKIIPHVSKKQKKRPNMVSLHTPLGSSKLALPMSSSISVLALLVRLVFYMTVGEGLLVVLFFLLGIFAITFWARRSKLAKLEQSQLEKAEQAPKFVQENEKTDQRDQTVKDDVSAPVSVVSPLSDTMGSDDVDNLKNTDNTIPATSSHSSVLTVPEGHVVIRLNGKAFLCPIEYVSVLKQHLSLEKERKELLKVRTLLNVLQQRQEEHDRAFNDDEEYSEEDGEQDDEESEDDEDDEEEEEANEADKVDECNEEENETELSLPNGFVVDAVFAK